MKIIKWCGLIITCSPKRNLPLNKTHFFCIACIACVNTLSVASTSFQTDKEILSFCLAMNLHSGFSVSDVLIGWLRGRTGQLLFFTKSVTLDYIVWNTCLEFLTIRLLQKWPTGSYLISFHISTISGFSVWLFWLYFMLLWFCSNALLLLCFHDPLFFWRFFRTKRLCHPLSFWHQLTEPSRRECASLLSQNIAKNEWSLQLSSFEKHVFQRLSKRNRHSLSEVL